MHSLIRHIGAVLFLLMALPVFAQNNEETKTTTSDEGKSFEKVSFDFKDADLRNVLRIFATKADVNIIAGPDVTGSVTMRLRNVPWEKALGLILDVNGYGFQRDGNIIKVLTSSEMQRQPTQTQVFFLNYAEAKNLEKAISQLLSKDGKVRTDNRSNTVIVTDLPQNLAKIAPVINRLDQQTPQVLVQSMVVETNAVALENVGINWAFLDSYRIGVQGISATYTDSIFASRTNITSKSLSKTFSISNTVQSQRFLSTTGTGSGSQTFNFIPTFTNTRSQSITNTEFASDFVTDQLFDNRQFTDNKLRTLNRTATLSADTLEIFISLLENTTDTKILSAPEVLTTNNQSARILVGEQYPLANYVFNDDTGTLEVQGFTYIDIGIKLDVTPKISPDGYVTLDVVPEIKTRGANIPFAGSTGTVVPIINTQEVEVQAVVKDRETLVIGGLITDDNIEEIIKVPILGDIPFIGARFFTDKSITKNRRNLFVFITPTIVTSKNAGKVVEARRKLLDGHADGIPPKERSFWSPVNEDGNERDLDLELDTVYTGHMGGGSSSSE